MGKRQRIPPVGLFHFQPFDIVTPRPIQGKKTFSDIAVETGIRPVSDIGDIPVFDGIVMNVVDVAFKIPVITDNVLPEPALPDGTLSLFDATS